MSAAKIGFGLKLAAGFWIVSATPNFTVILFYIKMNAYLPSGFAVRHAKIGGVNRWGDAAGATMFSAFHKIISTYE